jgi:hypothetical protein
VLVVWYQRPNLGRRARILSARSLDRGGSWSSPAVVATRVPTRGDPPFPTVVRAGGGFVACGQQQPPGRPGQVTCSRSPDGGAWSRPRTVGRPEGAGEAAQPALAAAPDGRLWLAFYRFDRRSTTVELWGSRGRTAWRRRAVLMRRAVPRSGSYFLGDYQGLAATRRHVIAAFTMPVRAHAVRQEDEDARYAGP